MMYYMMTGSEDKWPKDLLMPLNTPAAGVFMYRKLDKNGLGGRVYMYAQPHPDFVGNWAQLEDFLKVDPRILGFFVPGVFDRLFTLKKLLGQSLELWGGGRFVLFDKDEKPDMPAGLGVEVEFGPFGLYTESVETAQKVVFVLGKTGAWLLKPVNKPLHSIRIS